MRRIDLDVLAGTLVTLLPIVVGVPMLLQQLAGHDPIIGPAWVWWLLLAGYLATLAGCTWLITVLPRGWLLCCLAVQVLIGPALVLLAPAAGWTPILLVLTAALSVYLVPLRLTAVIIVGNSFTILVMSFLGGGEIVEMVIGGAIYLVLQGVSVLAVVLQRREEEARRRLSVVHTELRATTTLLDDASRTAERLRIARDLHDVIGHQVTALALELEVASHLVESPAAEHVSRGRRIAKDLLGDLRATVSQLRDDGQPLGEALACIVASLPSPRVHLDVPDTVQLDEQRRTVLVRCVQEIVTNTIRHADAANLWIDVASDLDGTVTLQARDDGRGAPRLHPGNGLTGMRERVELVGGEVAFVAGDGFRVSARLPAAP